MNVLKIMEVAVRERCVNDDMSFHCDCSSGFSLLENGFSCESKKIEKLKYIDVLDTTNTIPIGYIYVVIFTFL